MMEPQTKQSAGAKDFFINLGAIVALYTLVVSLINLLFTVINTAYPQTTDYYGFVGSSSISWPVATLIIFFPIFILLMWFMERSYTAEPERKGMGIHKWLTYITLFISGLGLAGDLIVVLYYFLDGQELTTGFLLKILVVLIVTGAIFTYYISEIRDRLTAKSRKMWRVATGIIILVSVVWGFSVLGSPATQRQYKADEQTLNYLTNFDNQVRFFYSTNGHLPKDTAEVSAGVYVDPNIPITQQVEYTKTGNLTYNLCTDFKKESPIATQPNIYARPVGYQDWTHPAGHYCFSETIIPGPDSKIPLPAPKY